VGGFPESHLQEDILNLPETSPVKKVGFKVSPTTLQSGEDLGVDDYRGK
jgi:hypothetical protein